ncbi:sperm motility kinase X-like [Phodopus roborovskii]|uniref:sperm motility kinase X-like n=1 Tax=Phodopus roborovskii TaxID=109678 RepID=UPI0021E505DA|nr:sperm motility kinase X-like [Phodopus roborovskii]
MDTIKTLTNKTSEQVTMELDLKASASEEETLTDHYVMLNSLGKGAFAEVKLAYHLHTEVQVAIKVLKMGTKNDSSVKTEMDIMKTLNHPNITQLFHLINTKEYTYMVMEHVAGGDLVSHVERVGRLQEDTAQHIFAQVVCAVDYCHMNGIAHRDIKLDNILMDGKGNIKLCDFGLAAQVTPGQGTKGFCGTLEYCAPELFCDTEYDARAVDIWSMGVVLYAMVTASFPFKANTYSEMKEEMLDPKYHLPYTLSEKLQNIIVQLLTVQPEQRPTISDIRQHQWLMSEEEFLQITPSLDSLCNKLNPSIVVAMWSMGYDPKDISSSLQEKKFNHIMATYLILNHKSPRDHSKYAAKFLQAHVDMTPSSAAANFHSQRGLSELVLPTLQEEHQVHDEKVSRKKRMRSMSMPATLCSQQKENKHLSTAPKFAQQITYSKSRILAMDSMTCNWSSSISLSSESISSPMCVSSEPSQVVNTSDNSSYTESTHSISSYSEVPHSVNPKATYDIQRSSLWVTSKHTADDVPSEGIPEVQKSFLQATSKNSYDVISPEGIPEIQRSSLQQTLKKTFTNVPLEAIPEIQNYYLQTTSKYICEDVPSEDLTDVQRTSLQETSKNSIDDDHPEGISEFQKPSLQEISKNSFEDVPPEVITAASANHLSRGWKRVKKRIGSCLRLLCCCMPASKRSHVSQSEPVEVESGACPYPEAHTQGIPDPQRICTLNTGASVENYQMQTVQSSCESYRRDLFKFGFIWRKTRNNREDECGHMSSDATKQEYPEAGEWPEDSTT